MNHHKKYLLSLIAKGGPRQEDYYDLDAWIIEVSEQLKLGVLNKEDVTEMINLFGEAFSSETMQGFAFQKPHGYAGDFEIIDRIYQGYTSSKPHLSNWDHYWQSHAAADAVRNRIHYLNDLLANKQEGDKNNRIEVLNLASGPGRDLLNYFHHAANDNIYFDCVEQDKKAIAHATTVCKDYLDHINFINRNALRFHTDKRYDLIWSAGLFDYFDDKVFVFVLKRLAQMLGKAGEIVIGNFSTKNPSKPYMELFEWNLHHRSPNTLKELAVEAGFKEDRIEVSKEKTGVNLFLHVTL